EVVVGDDPELLSARGRQQTRDCLLNHGLLAIERKQLLGAFLAAERPEARATPAREDYRVKVGGHQEFTISGSETAVPGTNDRMKCTLPSGCTSNCVMFAGITTASPLANWTGSQSRALKVPAPSIATRIWADDFPALAVNCCADFNSYFSTAKYGDATSCCCRPPPPFRLCGECDVTLPERTFSLMTRRPFSRWSSRGRP